MCGNIGNVLLRYSYSALESMFSINFFHCLLYVCTEYKADVACMAVFSARMCIRLQYTKVQLLGTPASAGIPTKHIMYSHIHSPLLFIELSMALLNGIGSL